MAQATITPLNFIGRELTATDEPGRFRMGEITELNRESVIDILLEDQELSQVQAIEETEPGIFILALDVWEEDPYMPGSAHRADFIAFLPKEGRRFEEARYLIMATAQADGELADRFRDMIEHERNARAEFNYEDDTITVF
jgi:hypothetical protein